MFSSVLSAAVVGVSCIPIQIEADVSNGLPMFSMVGYLSARVKEAQDRVRTALKNTGFQFPAKNHRQSFPGRYPQRGNRV